MSLPRAYGAALGTAAFRQTPADFHVEEILGFAADGDGPQQLLKLRKTGANTAYVAGLLARYAGVPERDVGYAELRTPKKSWVRADHMRTRRIGTMMRCISCGVRASSGR